MASRTKSRGFGSAFTSRLAVASVLYGNSSNPHSSSPAGDPGMHSEAPLCWMISKSGSMAAWVVA
jgi:hypothetical protein